VGRSGAGHGQGGKDAPLLHTKNHYGRCLRGPVDQPVPAILGDFGDLKRGVGMFDYNLSEAAHLLRVALGRIERTRTTSCTLFLAH